METFARSFALEGIEILDRAKGGDGRTIEAYAAVFDIPTEVHDAHGDYMEVIHRSAFNRTLANGAGNSALFLYNHGRTVVDGRPDSLAQVPIGSPKSIKADGRGLRTVSQLNRSILADSVLEAVRNGDIKGYSFRGSAYRSDPRGPVPKARPGAELPTVTRMELSLADYGPTPTPYYVGAEIVALRSASAVLSTINGLDESERAELFRMLLDTTRGSVPDPATATSRREPGAEDPRETAHSGRLKDLARQRELAAWADLAYMEMAVNG